MTFTFEYELDNAEHVRAARVMFNRRRDTKLTYAFLAFCLVFVAAAHFWLQSRGREGWLPGLIIMAIAMVGGIAGLQMTPSSTVANMRKNNRSIAGPHVIALGADGLKGHSPGVASSFEWANITEAVETKEFVFLYISKGMAMFIPKRVIAGEDLARVREALHEWIGDRAHTLSPRIPEPRE